MKHLVCLGFVMLLMAAARGAAQSIPARLTEQGRLTDAMGKPISGGAALTFAIYEAATGGSALWTETQTLSLTDGYFSVQLGSKTAFPPGLWDGSVRFIGIKVNSDDEMTPREEVASVPYALAAGNVVGDISPHTVSVAGKQVIDEMGHWVGAMPVGAKGDPGAPGEAGPAGPKGDTGPAGPKGDTGPSGPASLKGDPGPAGPAGPKGDTGAPGLAGAKGDTGAAGPAGPKGDTGPKGDPGMTGPAGPGPAPGSLNHNHTLATRIAMGDAMVLAPGTQTVGYISQNCNTGETVTGGGCNFGAGTTAGTLHLVSSFPNGQNGWSCYYENTGTGTPTVRVYAMCTTVNSATLP